MRHPKIDKALAQIALYHPFYSALLMMGKIQSSDSVPTAGTDGEAIYYNNQFVDLLTVPETVFLLVHEAEHITHLHPFRINRFGLQKEKYNIAADHVINTNLIALGLTPIRKEVIQIYADAQYKSMTAEQVYHQLPDNPEQQPQEGEGNSEGSGDGEQGKSPMMRDLMQPKAGESQDEVKARQQRVTDHVHKAAQIAKQMGRVPQHLKDYLDKLATPKVDWREVLRAFVTATAKNDYSWSGLNRRVRHRGIRLPVIRSEQVGEIVFVIDTSGSVWDWIEQFVSECAAAASDCRPTRTHFIWCDTEVQRHDDLDSPDEAEARLREMVRGGGTDLRAAFTYIDKHQIEPECIVVLTDLETPFPKVSPNCSVLWVSTTDHPVPFGSVVRISQ